MNKVYMILSGTVEKSTAKPDENVGVVSVVYVSESHENITSKIKELRAANLDVFYMEYETLMDTDLTTLEHYPSIEISKDDLL